MGTLSHDGQCEASARAIAISTLFGAELKDGCQCAVREVAWVAREALAIHTEHVSHDSPRAVEFFGRKRQLLAFIEAEL